MIVVFDIFLLVPFDELSQARLIRHGTFLRRHLNKLLHDLEAVLPDWRQDQDLCGGVPGVTRLFLWVLKLAHLVMEFLCGCDVV